jgi:pRiA4b ORF-3-like protein
MSVAGKSRIMRCCDPFGYVELLDAIADPKHERHAELTEWVGDDFDPEVVQAEALIAEVAALAKSWSRKSKRKAP